MTHSSKNPQMASARFQLLALGFAHPAADRHRLMVAGDYTSALSEAGIAADLPPVNEDFTEFEADYINLFQLGSRGRPVVSLNAADHSVMGGSENRPEFLLSYSSWYRHFGLRVVEGEGANELPDHLVCQLEFMCWLSHLVSVNTDSENYVLAQRDFMLRQLRPFLEALVLALESCGNNNVAPFYASLASTTLEAVTVLQAVHEVGIVEPVRFAEITDDKNAVNLWE
jgi:DMSO reductase family type II enzyme chaperone